MNQTFTPGMGGPYNNWNFQLNQQVLLIPEAGKGVQVVINSLDNMEHPWHLQYVTSSPALSLSLLRSHSPIYCHYYYRC